MSNNIYDIVQEYLRYGRSIIPSGGGDDRKKPLVDWKPFQNSLPTLEQVQRWQAELNPTVWGMPTGKVSNCFVIDCDSPEAVAIMENAGLKPHVKTPRGGCHYYCRLPDWPIVNKVGVLPQLDIRGQGGYVNFCGGNGTGSYVVLIQPTDDSLIEFERLPEKLKQSLKTGQTDKTNANPTDEIIPEGERNQFLTKIAGSIRRYGISELVMRGLLKDINTAKCEPPLSEVEVNQIAKSVSRYQPASGSLPTEAESLSEVYCPGFVLTDGTVGEMIVEPETRNRLFVVKDQTGEVMKVNAYVSGNVEYKPIHGTLAEGTISFPSDIADYKSIVDLYAEVRAYIHKYVELPDDFEAIASLYALLTWVYDGLPVVPYLRSLGDYGSGKTTFGDVMAGIVYRAIQAGGATTTSPIFRFLDIYRGTLVLDEADFGRSDDKSEIIKILNSGYKTGCPVLRSEATSTKSWEPRSYNVYGPKILASRRHWDDQALESRCFTWQAEGLTREDIPRTRGPRFREQACALRCKLLRFRLDYLPKVKLIDFEDVKPIPDIDGRLQEIIMPLKEFANGDSQLVEILDNFIKKKQEELTENRGATLPALIVEALVTLHQSGVELSAQEIAIKLNEENTISDFLEHPERGISPRKVGQILKNLGLITKRSPSSRRFTAQWDESRITKLHKRYGLSSPPKDNVTDVTSDTTTLRAKVTPSNTEFTPDPTSPSKSDSKAVITVTSVTYPDGENMANRGKTAPKKKTPKKKVGPSKAKSCPPKEEKKSEDNVREEELF